MEKHIKAFWKEYIESNEDKRREIILTLTGIDESNVSIFQSYIDDLIEYFYYSYSLD